MSACSRWGCGVVEQFLADNLIEIFTALAVALLSWSVSSVKENFWIRRRVRKQIAVELVAIQRHLYNRANPDEWKQKAVRDEWMLSPFLRHIDLLAALAGQERLDGRMTLAIREYRDCTKGFALAWSKAERRRDENFWKPYNQTLASGEAALRVLGQLRLHQTTWEGLVAQPQPKDTENGGEGS